MSIDTKFIGKKYAPVKYLVSKEKVKEYAVAIGDFNPLYLEGVMAPPSFAVVYAREILGKCLLDKELALNLAMLVHGEQSMEFFAPVKCEDYIFTEGEVKNIYDKPTSKGGSNAFVVVETISKNQLGDIVCKAEWTFVVRGDSIKK